jgi:2-polyprenyl-6-hydroxyphenyl methylase/3-demethylubiquinone-9 3-methyltransferase
MTSADYAQALPGRYRQAWDTPFRTEIARRLHADMTILDIGGGRRPALPRERRPQHTTYIGLDPDASEFAAAPVGAYDDVIASNAETRIPRLAGTIDLAVSWQVFEHVSSLDAVLRNTYSYLKPGGALVSLFSGRWSVFALINRLLTDRISAPIVSRASRRKAINAPVFPAYYDSCLFSDLDRLTSDWRAVQIVAFYRGATYFGFAPFLMRAYLMYEDVIHRAQWRNGATHYLLVAHR